MMTADERALAVENSTGYRDGFRAGYSLGNSDGISRGYTDAKCRAHAVVKSLPDPASHAEITKRLNANVGTADED